MSLRRAMMRQSRGIAIALLVTAACAGSSKPAAGDLPIGNRFLAATLSDDGDAGQRRGPRWWTSFKDPQLNAYIKKALRENYTLSAAWSRLNQANWDARVAGAGLWPTVTAAAGAVNRRGQNAQSAFLPTSTVWSVGLAASYELDLWGQLRSTKNAARAEVRASVADMQAAAITLTGEVTIAWYRWIEAQHQIKLRREQIKTLAQILRLVEARYAQGQVSAQDVLRQRQLIDSTKNEELSVISEALRWRNRLASLTEVRAEELEISDDAQMPSPPPLPQLGTPLKVIERRPDLQASWQRFFVADASAAAAYAQRFPRLTFQASTNSASQSVANLFQNWLTTLGANVLAPIFDGGRLRGREKSARYGAQAAWFDYAQAAVDAANEVEDALVNEAEIKARVESLTRQRDLSRRGLDIARAGYVAGRTTFIETLDAVTTLQTIERDLLISKRSALEIRVALHRAVAGPLELDEDTMRVQP